jgi:hypothetical protein
MTQPSPRKPATSTTVCRIGALSPITLKSGLKLRRDVWGLRGIFVWVRRRDGVRGHDAAAHAVSFIPRVTHLSLRSDGAMGIAIARRRRALMAPRVLPAAGQLVSASQTPSPAQRDNGRLLNYCCPRGGGLMLRKWVASKCPRCSSNSSCRYSSRHRRCSVCRSG